MCGLAVAILEGAGAPSVSVVRADPRTGRLVRAIVRQRPAAERTSAPAAPPPGSAGVSGIAETVDRIARQNQLSPRLVHSVIQVESNYDANAVSPKGAQGLMQLIPSTARRFGVSNVFDPADNIQGGARYLKYLLGMYNGDEVLALAAYNAGEAAVSRYGGVPPFPETQGYVARVRQRLAGAATPQETGGGPSAVQSNEANAQENAPEAIPAVAYNPIREVMDSSGRIYYISH
jgi:soluble lytic murein transglycosylase-like protein